MNTPSKPIRKGTPEQNDNLARPTTKSAVNKSEYKRQSVAPFSSPGKGAYVRKSVGVSPSTVPINDKDAGKGTGNAR